MRRSIRLTKAAALWALVLASAAPASSALAWGATGHRLIGQLGVATLPPDAPAFLRTTQTEADVGELAREPDRWKGSGLIHDTERDPAHFLDLDDQGKVLGGPFLSALPPNRSGYDTALRAVGTDSFHAGFLPYAIVDGWQQLVKDFAYWRALEAAIPRERDAEHKAWMEADLVRREALTVRDLGVWAHYVGDASQPMHVSIHFNGWGPYPNPNGYTQDKVHAAFEGAFVRQNITRDQVLAAMAPPAACGATIEVCTARYLAQTNAAIVTYFALQKAGGFADGDPRGRAFVAQRLAAGASELRDLIMSAWNASAQGTVGYPPLTVDQVTRGGIDPYDNLYGED